MILQFLEKKTGINSAKVCSKPEDNLCLNGDINCPRVQGPDGQERYIVLSGQE